MCNHFADSCRQPPETKQKHIAIFFLVRKYLSLIFSILGEFWYLCQIGGVMIRVIGSVVILVSQIGYELWYLCQIGGVDALSFVWLSNGVHWRLRWMGNLSHHKHHHHQSHHDHIDHHHPHSVDMAGLVRNSNGREEEYDWQPPAHFCSEIWFSCWLKSYSEIWSRSAKSTQNGRGGTSHKIKLSTKAKDMYLHSSLHHGIKEWFNREQFELITQ